MNKSIVCLDIKYDIFTPHTKNSLRETQLNDDWIRSYWRTLENHQLTTIDIHYFKNEVMIIVNEAMSISFDYKLTCVPHSVHYDNVSGCCSARQELVRLRVCNVRYYWPSNGIFQEWLTNEFTQKTRLSENKKNDSWFNLPSTTKQRRQCRAWS